MPVENLLTALVAALAGGGVGWAAAALVPVFPPLPDDDDEAGGTETTTNAAATTGSETTAASNLTAGTGTTPSEAAGATDTTAGRVEATAATDTTADGATSGGEAAAPEATAAADAAAARGTGGGEGAAARGDGDEDEEPQAPPAACPGCGTELSTAALAKVAVRGRCAACGTPLRTRTALIAGTGAVLLGLTGLAFGPTPLLPAYLFLGAVSVVLGFIDLRVKRLPNVFTLPAYPIGLVLLAVAAPLMDGGWGLLLDAVIGMAAMWAFFFVLWFIYPAGMGFGDVKLSGIIGMFLGWFGLTMVLMGGFAGFLLAGLYGLTLILLGKANRKTAIPFGPFMMLGALLVVLAPPLIVMLG